MGTVVGGVRVDAVTGRGGMGVVYRGTQVALKRTVALKVVRDDLAGDPEFRRRFTLESEIAASLDHPNIVPIHSAGEDQGRLYVTMRFVDGTDVREAIRERGRLEPALAAEVVAQVAAALDAAHRRGLVHRDVKPANMLLGSVDGRPHVYLTDFGLSRFADSEQLTRTGTVVGTLDYMAPEQLEGRAVDHRVDVYALGCVLHQALTGTVPFPRDTEHAKMWAHMTEPPPRPGATAPDLPAAFDAVVARALAKRPDDRYASAGELGAAALAAVGTPARGAEPTVDVRRRAAGSTVVPPTAAPAWMRGRVARPAGAVARAEGASRVGRAPLVPDPRRGGSAPGNGWAASGPQAPAGPASFVGRPVTGHAVAGQAFAGGAPSHPSVPPPAPAGLAPGHTPITVPPAGSRVARAVGLVLVVLLLATAAVGVLLWWNAADGGGGGTAAGTVDGAPVAVGKDPRDVETGAGLVWTANAGDASISRVDPAGGAAQQITVGGVPVELAVSDGGVWVWNYSNAVTRVDVATGVVDGPISANGVGDITGITAGGGFLWLSHASSNSVSRIDLATRQATGTPTPVGAAPVGLAYGNRAVYVANTGETTVTVLDGATGAVAGGPITLAEKPAGIAVHDGTIYVGTTDDVTPVDEGSYVVGDPVPLRGGSLFVADRDGVWVAFPLENRLRRLDLQGQETHGGPVVGVGKGVGDLALLGDALWVSNSADGTVVQVRIAG